MGRAGPLAPTCPCALPPPRDLGEPQGTHVAQTQKPGRSRRPVSVSSPGPGRSPAPGSWPRGRAAALKLGQSRRSHAGSRSPGSGGAQSGGQALSVIFKERFGGQEARGVGEGEPPLCPPARALFQTPQRGRQMATATATAGQRSRSGLLRLPAPPSPPRHLATLCHH